MEIIFQKIKEQCEKGESAVLVLVTESSDGTPGKTGAKMLVGREGAFCGTVGGGSIEYHAVQTAQKMLTKEKHFLCEEYALRLDDDENKLGMTCGGNEKLLFYVFRSEEGIAFANRGLQMCSEKRPYCLAVPMNGNKAKILTTENFHAHCKEFGYDTASYYTEFFLHEGKVFIFGGGHVARELLPLLTNLNFRCILLDDREEFISAERFPTAEETILVDYQSLNVPVQKNDLAVIMTRGHQFDAECERFLLGTKASYIGVMGSRKKADYIRRTLLSEGFSEENLARVTTPIGLSIGSRTPAEIAVSIAAQLIQVRSEQRKRENPS